jgi:hypothetical protein
VPKSSPAAATNANLPPLKRQNLARHSRHRYPENASVRSRPSSRLRLERRTALPLHFGHLSPPAGVDPVPGIECASVVMHLVSG